MKKQSNQVLQDFVFGGIEADETRLLAAERTRLRGIRHGHHISPQDPQPGEPVHLAVTIGPDAHIDRLCAYFTTDGSIPQGTRGTCRNGSTVELTRTAVRWEPLLWDFVEEWQGTLPGHLDSTLIQYTIEGWSEQGTPGDRDGQDSWYSREPNLDGVDEASTLYGYHVDSHQTPDWARDAVVYHVFVDRFARGLEGGAVQEGWLQPEQLESFMGGDLAGVTARLPYIADLGVNALWLSPIFKAHSYHGYDTCDFQEIDPRFGTKAELQDLIETAHSLGLRVILDFVANHSSDQAWFFQEAKTSPQSPRRNWFSFGPQFSHGYRTFFNVAKMPQFQTDDRGARDYLIESACYWLQEFQVDGYRLDYAAGPSHGFWSEFSAACRAVKRDCWLFGEVTQAGADLAAYHGKLDGCLHFEFLRRVRLLCAGQEPAIRLSEFTHFVERTQHFYPDGFLLPSFLDNHDTNRFAWVAQNDPTRLRLALGLLFALGGPPILYYGTEIGLSQPREKGPWREESRHPMPWNQVHDRTTLGYTKSLIRLRRTVPALCRGDVRTLFCDDDAGVSLLERHAGDSLIRIGINLSDEDRPVRLPAGLHRELLTDTDLTGECVTVPARSVRFYGL